MILFEIEGITAENGATLMTYEALDMIVSMLVDEQLGGYTWHDIDIKTIWVDIQTPFDLDEDDIISTLQEAQAAFFNF